VRPARAADRPAISALQEGLEALHARLQPRFFRVLVGPRAHEADESPVEALLVVEDEQAICGVCRVVVYDTPRAPLMVPARRAHVEELYVHQAHRRSGCGRALMEAAGRWARERGAIELVLTVWDGNADAERFYERLGYRRVSQALAKEL